MKRWSKGQAWFIAMAYEARYQQILVESTYSIFYNWTSTDQRMYSRLFWNKSFIKKIKNNV